MLDEMKFEALISNCDKDSISVCYSPYPRQLKKLPISSDKAMC